MIWEHNVPVVLMLTNLIEDENIKAEIYWPHTLGKAVRYGDFIVLLKKEEVKSSLILRFFNIWLLPKPVSSKNLTPRANNDSDVSMSDESGDIVDFSETSEEVDDYREFDITEPEGDVRTIVQIHCSKWPDLGVPNSCESMEELLQEVDRYKKGLNEPILVHCRNW